MRRGPMVVIASLLLVAVASLAWLARSRNVERAAGPARGDASTPAPADVPAPAPAAPPQAVAEQDPGGATRDDAERASEAPPVPPKSTLLSDFEAEPRDAGAAAAEGRIREIFASYDGNAGVLRDVRCTQTVCQLQVRWSQAITKSYNAALVQIVGEFSRELSIEPDGAPDGTVVPVRVLVRRRAPQAGDLATAR